MQPDMIVRRAQACLRNGDAAGAEQHLRDGLGQWPTWVDGWCGLADLLNRRHAYEDALAASARALPAPAAQVSHGRTLCAVGRVDEAMTCFSRALNAPELDDALKSHALMELGTALDRARRYEDAWQAITLGQQLRRRLALSAGLSPHWLSDHLVAMHTWLERRQDPPEAHPWDDPRPLPVFLVGVPRSGTTLMEQILIAAGCDSTAERPALSRAVAGLLKRPGTVYPAGLDDWGEAEVRAIRDAFFALAAAQPGKRVLHKMPIDLLHLGLVDRVFAGAPVIQALRDPRDTVLSGFFQNMELSPAMLNWTDPKQLAVATHGLLTLGRRWAQLPTLNLRVQRYDRLTDDPEPEMRSLVEHAGLPFTESVVRFHEQAKSRSIATPSSHEVVKPVHRAARARWRRYERWLEPVLPILAPSLEAHGF